MKVLLRTALVSLSLVGAFIAPALAQSSEVVGIQQSFMRAGEPNPSPEEVKAFVSLWNPYDPSKAVVVISNYLKARAFGVDLGCFKNVFKPGMSPQDVVGACKR